MVVDLCSVRSSNVMPYALTSLRLVTAEITQTFTRLEASSPTSVMTGESDELILELLYSLDNLSPAKGLSDILIGLSLPKDNRFQGQEDLVHTVTKLRKYRASCEFLLKATSNITIFRNIMVEKVMSKPHVISNTRGVHSLTACLNRVGIT